MHRQHLQHRLYVYHLEKLRADDVSVLHAVGVLGERGGVSVPAVEANKCHVRRCSFVPVRTESDIPEDIIVLICHFRIEAAVLEYEIMNAWECISEWRTL